MLSALAWMALALSSFCLVAIGGRELSAHLSTMQILFFRGVIGLLLMSVVMLCLRRRRLHRTGLLKLHLLRNVFHFGGQYGWFVGLAFLPLAEVFALEFTVPIWTALVAAIWLGERLTWQRVVAIALGLVGVLIIVQPGLQIVSPVAMVVLAAAMAYGVSHSASKPLARQEHPLTILFYMCLVQLPISGAFVAFDWQWPGAAMQWMWLAVIAVMALLAHYALTRALALIDVTVVVTVDFLRLPLIAMLGVAVYDEALRWSVLVGGVVMLVANCLIVRRPKVVGSV